MNEPGAEIATRGQSSARLLCWNMAHRKAAWPRLLELAESVGADVALVQEAGRPSGSVADRIVSWPRSEEPDEWHTWDRPDSTGRHWCSALVTFPWSRMSLEGEPRTRLDAAKWDAPTISHPGQFAVGRVSTATGQSLTLVSLYGLWDTQPGKRWIFTEATLHRAVSDLTPLLQAGERVVIGGDLNLLYGYGDLDQWVVRGNTLFDRLATYGVEVVGPFRPDGAVLDDCPCAGGDSCRHVPTRPDPSGRPWQLDWILSNMGEDCFEMSVLEIDPDYSDHAPVVVDVFLD